MAHPRTHREIIAALEENARSIINFFSSVPERSFFEGDPDHWGPAHHLVHLTQTSVAVERAFRSGRLPTHSTGRSRAYAEVRDHATSSLEATPKQRLLEMGRKALIEEEAQQSAIVASFAAASEALRKAAASWSEDALDAQSMVHPLMGELTVREMLLFFVVHERHHLRIVRERLGPNSLDARTEKRGG